MRNQISIFAFRTVVAPAYARLQRGTPFGYYPAMLKLRRASIPGNLNIQHISHGTAKSCSVRRSMRSQGAITNPGAVLSFG